MGQYWTRKGDQEDRDERTVCPWTDRVGHGDRNLPYSESESEDRISKPMRQKRMLLSL